MQFNLRAQLCGYVGLKDLSPTPMLGFSSLLTNWASEVEPAVFNNPTQPETPSHVSRSQFAFRNDSAALLPVVRT